MANKMCLRAQLGHKISSCIRIYGDKLVDPGAPWANLVGLDWVAQKEVKLRVKALTKMDLPPQRQQRTARLQFVALN